MSEHKVREMNGTAGPPAASSSGLTEAINAHARALIAANTDPNGMMAVNPMEIFVDLELAQVRIEVLFEALCAKGMIDPAALTVMLRDKLLKEVAELDERPRITLPIGNVRPPPPRRNG
jgi:hypothetical protein